MARHRAAALMEPTALVAILLVGFAVAALISTVLQRSWRQAAERTAALEARGWRTTKTGRGFRVDGGEQVPWSLTLSRSSGSGSSSSTQTLWETPAEPTDAVVLIGPKLPPVLTSIDLGGGLAQLALRAILGDEAADLADAHEVDVGSPAFRERFTVIASDPDLAAELVVPEVEHALLHASFTDAAVLRWRDRLQVRISHGAWHADEVVGLVELGTTVAERCGYGPMD